jgi:hypothetical protein
VDGRRTPGGRGHDATDAGSTANATGRLAAAAAAAIAMEIIGITYSAGSGGTGLAVACVIKCLARRQGGRNKINK